MKISRVILVASLCIAGCGDDEEPQDGGQGADAGVPAANYRLAQTNLVGDQAGAAHQDPMLINAWGLAFGPTGVIWVASNGNGTARLYDANGVPSATLPAVVVPAPSGATGTSAPTGQVANGDAAAFRGDLFILSTEDGTIAGWKPANGATAVLEVDNSAGADHPVYKGLTITTANGVTRLYAADFHNNKIDIFDANFAPITVPNAFVDPNLPAGYAPFNVRVIGAKIYVAYAKQDSARKDDVPGAGNGYVDAFNLDGSAPVRLISAGPLDSPWGMTLAPANFGGASNTLLVGNFGDGRINAFNITSGELVSNVKNTSGAPLVIEGLWSIEFGRGAAGEAQNQLFFTAGPGDESHGLLGRLDVAQ